MPQRLTLKQRQFTKEYLKSSNGTQSALQVYDTKDPRVAQAIASENLSKPIISKTIEEALSKKNLTLDTISENINYLASSRPEKINADTMLKANIEFLKLLKAYPDKKSYSFNMSLSGKVKDMSYADTKKQLESINNTLDSLQDDDTIEPITDTE